MANYLSWAIGAQNWTRINYQPIINLDSICSFLFNVHKKNLLKYFNNDKSVFFTLIYMQLE